jgi:hypothetical protein
MEFNIDIRNAHGDPGRITMDDVWGVFDNETLEPVHFGMLKARGLPLISEHFTVEEHLKITERLPDICPVWGDKLGYKSVTCICEEAIAEEVSYWLEYVHGGGSISRIQELNNGMVALRSDYMCW